MIPLLLACSHEPEEVPFNTFGDVHQPQLDVHAGNVPPAGPRVQVRVHPEIEGVCRALPELRAELDGVALTRLHGIYDDGTVRYDRDCFVYEFEGGAEVVAKVSAREQNVVTVSDGTTTLAATVRQLFAAPAFSGPTEPVVPGSEVLLAFTPSGDVVDPTIAVSVELVGEGVSARTVPAKAAADGVRFTMPEEVHGALTATVYGAIAFAPAVEACVSAAKCTTSRIFVPNAVALTVR
jgi:hypothetical protein